MTFIKFGKDQKIGIKEFDNQHKEIIDTINHLFKIKDHAKNEILESFNSLITQLKEHFNSEETFMKECKTVHFISHKLEHDRALSKYSDYYRTFKGNDSSFDVEILYSIKNWLENHLIKKDCKLLDCLGKK